MPAAATDVARARSPLFTVEDASITFPGVKAVDGVSLDLYANEVHALLGANGCGKSTLIKILAGFHQPDDGLRATFDGSEIDLVATEQQRDHPLRFVHQDLGLVNELSATDNIALSLGFLGSGISVDWKAENQRARGLLARFGVHLDPRRPLSDATAVDRTLLAVARALGDLGDAKHVLVLDEPTAALSSTEVERLFEAVRELRDAGSAVLYVSHRMDEIFEIADRVTVMRSGRVISSGPIGAMTPTLLTSLIAGEPTEAQPQAETPSRRPTSSARHTEAALAVRDLRSQSIGGVDFEVRRGEIVGVAGLFGSGREAVGYAAAGALPDASGHWEINGASFDRLAVRDAIDAGLGFVPADRVAEGLIREFTVLENLSLAALSDLGSSVRLSRRVEREQASAWLSSVGVRADAIDVPVTTLSGGNQQKIVFGRWLWRRPAVLVLCEPTAGVDIGARHALHELLREQAAAGLAVLITTSDLDDLVEVCDRVLVMRNGIVERELTGAAISTPTILAAMETDSGPIRP